MRAILALALLVAAAGTLTEAEADIFDDDFLSTEKELQTARIGLFDLYYRLNCGDWRRSIMLDVASEAARKNMHRFYRNRQKFFCYKDIRGFTRFVALIPATNSKARLASAFSPLPASFQSFKNRIARSDTCDFMTHTQLSQQYWPYITFLKRLQARAEATRLLDHIRLMLVNKRVVDRPEGREQFGGAHAVCVDVLLTPMYTQYVLQTFRKHVKAKGESRVMALFGGSTVRQLKEYETSDAQNYPSNSNLVREELGTNWTLPAVSRGYVLSQAQINAKFRNCHPICKKLLEPAKRSIAASMSTCCLQCIGSKCNSNAAFNRLMKYTYVESVSLDYPHYMKKIRLI